MTTKIGVWLLAVLSLLATVGFVAWTFVSDSAGAEQSQVYPVAVAQHIGSQIARAQPVTDWNFPLWSILVWMAWMIGVYGCGLAVRKRLGTGEGESTAAADFALDFALGVVVFAMVQLLVGLVGLVRVPLIPIFTIVGGVGIFRYQPDALRLPAALRWNWNRLKLPGRVLAVLFIFSTAVLVLPALVPPVQSDGMRYHLGTVQEYLKLGRIAYLPSNAYSNMPFLVEMHFMGALACRAPECSQLMHFTLAMLTVLSVYALGRRLSGGARALPLAAGAVYLLMPMSAILAGWPFTDHGISFFLVASVLTALKTAHRPNMANWVVLGIAIGGLLGTKYTMGPVGVAILLLPVVHPGSRRPSAVLVAALMTAIVGGVWYLKNLWFTGNPFYPLATALFGGGEWTPEANAFLTEKAARKGVGNGAIDFLTSPWDATFQWAAFEAHNPGPTLLLSFVGICVTGLLLFKQQKVMRWLLALLGLIYVIWFFSYQSNRLLLPFLALALAVSSAAPIGRTVARQIYLLSFGVAAAYGFLWAIQWAFVATGLSPAPLPYLLGAQDEKTFRYKSLTYGRAFDYLNKNVAAGEKVLLIGEHRIYGAEFSAVWSDWFDIPILAHLLRNKKLSSTQELLHYLQANNITWIMINEPELALQWDDFKARFTPAEWRVFEEINSLESPSAKVITLPPGIKLLHLESHK